MMEASADNPFTALTLIAAPAILANACSLLAMNTANRFGRVVDRSRQIKSRLGELPAGTDALTRWTSQLRSLDQRAEWLMRAQESFYASVGLFVLTAIVAVVGAALGARSSASRLLLADAAVLVGMFAAAMLFRGCTLVVRESRRTIRDLRRETALGELERAQLRQVTPGSREE